MADAPWFKFFPSDWLTGVRRLKARERGVYISLIAMMYDQGKPLADDLTELAEDCGVTRRQFDESLAILIQRGKIVSTENGLWNERVSCEILARSERISNSKAAVAERERKKAEKNQWQKSSPDDRQMIARSSILEPEPDPEVEKEESCPKPAAPAPDLFAEGKAASEPKKSRNQYTADFEAFWSGYPTSPTMSKVKTSAAWVKLGAEDRSRALSSVPEFKRWLSKQKPDYPVVHAVRYLTERRFDGFSKAAETRPVGPVDWDARLKYARDHSQWSTEKWGPMPGTPGCLAPRDKLLPSDGAGWTEFRKAS